MGSEGDCFFQGEVLERADLRWLPQPIKLQEAVDEVARGVQERSSREAVRPITGCKHRVDDERIACLLFSDREATPRRMRPVVQGARLAQFAALRRREEEVLEVRTSKPAHVNSTTSSPPKVEAASR